MVEILNMAEFFPAAAVIADADGEVQMTLGLGDIRVRAFDGIRRAEAMMRIEEEDSLELVLQEEAVPSAADAGNPGTEGGAGTECHCHEGAEGAQCGTDGRGGTASEGTVRSML